MNTNPYGAHVFSIHKDGKLFVAPTSTKDVATLEGSVFGGPNHLTNDFNIIPGLSASLLDAGTKKKKKEVIREALAGRGISLSFSADGDRTTFSGECLPEDLPFLLSTVAECLGEASFPEAEVKAEKVRTLGNIAEAKTDTATQASIALMRALYDPSHVNFSRTLEEREATIHNLDRRSLLEFKSQLGRNGLVLAVTGDVQPLVVKKAAEKAFGMLPEHGLSAVPKNENKKVAVASEKIISIPDKATIDVFLGAALPLHKLDPLYHPAYILTEMLGGGFVSHLMQTLRERDGLTYGIYARLSGLDDGADGYLRIRATFSPDTYTRSIETLHKEVKHFFSKGITEDTLQKKKEEIAGSYLVGLSTTRGLARTIHQIAIDGRDLSYLSEYPMIIRSASLAAVHTAADLIPSKKLSLAASGTFPKK
jgi:zinc protease